MKIRQVPEHLDPIEQLVIDGWRPDPIRLRALGIDQYHVHFERRVGKKDLTEAQIAKRVREGKQVKPTGGLTEVLLNANPSVMFSVALAVAKCNDTDKFDRHFGERLALARAIKQIADRYEAHGKALRELLT